MRPLSGSKPCNTNRAAVCVALQAIKGTRPRLVFLLRVVKSNKQKVIKKMNEGLAIGKIAFIVCFNSFPKEGKTFRVQYATYDIQVDLMASKVSVDAGLLPLVLLLCPLHPSFQSCHRQLFSRSFKGVSLFINAACFILKEAISNFSQREGADEHSVYSKTSDQFSGSTLISAPSIVSCVKRNEKFHWHVQRQ